MLYFQYLKKFFFSFIFISAYSNCSQNKGDGENSNDSNFSLIEQEKEKTINVPGELIIPNSGLQLAEENTVDNEPENIDLDFIETLCTSCENFRYELIQYSDSMSSSDASQRIKDTLPNYIDMENNLCIDIMVLFDIENALDEQVKLTEKLDFDASYIKEATISFKSKTSDFLKSVKNIPNSNSLRDEFLNTCSL